MNDMCAEWCYFGTFSTILQQVKAVEGMANVSTRTTHRPASSNRIDKATFYCFDSRQNAKYIQVNRGFFPYFLYWLYVFTSQVMIVAQELRVCFSCRRCKFKSTENMSDFQLIAISLGKQWRTTESITLPRQSLWSIHQIAITIFNHEKSTWGRKHIQQQYVKREILGVTPSFCNK